MRGRDAIYLDHEDAAACGISPGDRLRVHSAHGTMEGTAHLVRLTARSEQVHWPEGNPLLAAGPKHRASQSRTPDYNTVVRIEPLESTTRRRRAPLRPNW